MPRDLGALPLDYAAITEADRRRFWAKVNVGGRRECWEWTGYRTPKGYGRLRWHGVVIYAHRWSYLLHNRECSTDLTIDHLCRNHSCVNPDHLEAVSHETNIGRGVKANAQIKSCPKGHRYTPDNTYVQVNRTTGQRRRICRACKLDRLRQRNLDPAHKQHQKDYRAATRAARKAYEASPEYRARRLERDRLARAGWTEEQREAERGRAREAYRRRKGTTSTGQAPSPVDPWLARTRSR